MGISREYRRHHIENALSLGLTNLLNVAGFTYCQSSVNNRMQKLLTSTVTVICLMLSTWAGAQQTATDQLLSDVDRYRAQIELLETQVGRYHPGLMEGLERLAAAMIELDQFNEADEILDRAIQILRIDEGLYTESQFPFLVLSIRNNVRRGNWPDANETLDHLTYLYTLVPRQWNGELIGELLQISDLHLEGVAGDVEERKDYHYRAADRISWVATRLAERLWMPNDRRLVDLYYYRLKQNHMKYVTLNQGGPVSADLRQLAPNTGWMRPRRDVVESYYRIGLQMLQRMRTVYELQEPPDLEAIAMVDLYRADWQVLFDESNPEISYGRAYDNLLTAGVGELELQEFFSRPQLLPVADFHPTVQQASVAIDNDQNRPEGTQDIEPDLRFLEWASTSPNIQLPIDEPLLLQQEIQDMVTVHLAIRLDGIEKVSRWIRGRYVSQISVADSFEWLSRSFDQEISNEELTERLHYLNFRPVINQGIPQPYEGILEYHYFPIESE